MMKLFLILLMSAALVASTVGCGGGQMNKLKKLAAARKAAGKSSGEEESATPEKKTSTKSESGKAEVTEKKATANAKQKSGPQQIDRSSQADFKKNSQTANTDDPDFAAFKKRLLAKYETRRKELTQLGRIDAVARAFGEYVRSNRGFPARAVPHPAYRFSWRIELLPYLGYEELYKKIDQTSRYNSPINRRLIELMPPEYETCERKTKTNFVAPVATFTAYWREMASRTSRIEDGVSDTVGIVMVDDKHAVTWTQPTEYKLDPKNPSQGLVEKFGFSIVIFGDGRVEKVNKGVPDKYLIAMLSMDRGDSYPNNVVAALEDSDFVVSAEPNPGKPEVAKGSTPNVGKATKSDAGSGRPNRSFANRSGSNNDYSNRLAEASLNALVARDQSAALSFKLASLLVADEDARSFNTYRWCKALQRPTIGVRWSAGIMVPEKYLEKNSKTDINPIQRVVKRQTTSKRPGHDDLEKYTGQIGLDSMIVLRKLVGEGFFGEYLLQNIGTLDAENTNKPGIGRKRRENESTVKKASTDDELFDSRKLPRLNFSGIEIHTGPSRTYHMQVARERGNDLLLLFDVELKSRSQRASRTTRGSGQNRNETQKSETINITTMYVIDVRRGRELWKSAPLNNVKVEEERKNALKKDAVFEQLKKLDSFCRDELVLIDLPAVISRDNVLNRLKVLKGKKDENKIPFLAEARFYLEENLILLDDYKQFCASVIGSETEGLEFATGTPEQRYKIVKKYLPIGYSLALR